MKKLILISAVVGAFSLTAHAQDDMYFVPKKKEVAKERVAYDMPREVYYSGSDRDVDEYNRRYQIVPGDSTMGDVISFSGEEGVYPDSLGDYNITRKMSRWDGYTPTDAYWQGYDQGRSDEWAASTWHSPWYYSSYYPWYDSYWYDPWYYGSWGWRYSWYYDPWYYHRPYYSYGWGYYGYAPGWNRPVYVGGYVPSRHYSGGKTYAGTHNHSYGNRGRSGSWGGTSSRNSSGMRQATSAGRSNRSWSMGNSRSSVPTRSVSSGSSSSSGMSMGSSRSSSMGSSSSSMGSSRSSSGGSFGGSRGGGGSLGGGRSGGRR